MVTGSLQTKRGKYYAVLNFKDENGKRIARWFPLYLDEKGNKKKAFAMLNQLIAENKDHEIIQNSSDPLFTDYIQKWLLLEKNRIELSTWESYECYVRRHILPYFKPLNLTVGQVTVSHIKKYYDDKSVSGRGDKKAGGLSYASLKNHSKVLKQVLESAFMEELTDRNVAAKVPIPKNLSDKEDCEKMFLTAEEANAVLAAFQGHRMQPLIYVTLYYGLRKSEVLGLKWDAVDFDKNTIQIKHVIVKTKTIEAKDRTKSKNSKRTFELLPEIKEILQSLKEKQEANKMLCGSSYVDSGYIFTWDNGIPYRLDYITRAFKSQLKKCGLPQMTFHELRHSTASILYDKGWGLKDIQLFLGHADIETTGNIYLHIAKSRQKMMTIGLANTFKL